MPGSVSGPANDFCESWRFTDSPSVSRVLSQSQKINDRLVEPQSQNIFISRKIQKKIQKIITIFFLRKANTGTLAINFFVNALLPSEISLDFFFLVDRSPAMKPLFSLLRNKMPQVIDQIMYEGKKK